MDKVDLKQDERGVIQFKDFEEYKDYYNSLCDGGIAPLDRNYESTRIFWALERVKPEDQVLEIGCLDGIISKEIGERCAGCLSTDINAKFVERAKAYIEKAASEEVQKKMEFRASAVEELEVDKQFNLIIMMEVLEHVLDPTVVVRKCLEMLAPGGLLVITTPIGFWSSPEHIREYKKDRKELNELFAALGRGGIVTEINDYTGNPRWFGIEFKNE